MAVSFLEMEVLEHRGVFHEIETVIDITVKLLGEDQSIVDQFLIGHGCGKVHERVACLYRKIGT